LSPRRRIEPGEAPLLAEPPTPRRRQWRLPLMFTVAGLLIAEAITACTLVLISHETQRRAAMKNVTMLNEVRTFMTDFSSLDPANPNDYVGRILARSTGEFAKQYQEKSPLVLLGMAKGEPTTGTVLDAGVERWNDDGSANVLVALQVNAKSPDGKNTVDVGYRWLVTAEQEGDQWKISHLSQVV
jgi:Mce-associated membrane protein